MAQKEASISSLQRDLEVTNAVAAGKMGELEALSQAAVASAKQHEAMLKTQEEANALLEALTTQLAQFSKAQSQLDAHLAGHAKSAFDLEARPLYPMPPANS